MARYKAKPGNPPYLYDTHKKQIAGTFITFEGAAAKAYILNVFSEGIYAGVANGR